MLVKGIKAVLSAFFISVITAACQGGGTNAQGANDTMLNTIPQSQWQKLSGKRIFFGHQSVGFNIVEGLQDVQKNNPQIKVNTVETSDPKIFGVPVFAHAAIGKNYDPRSKVDAFVALMDQGLGSRVDVAFMKFCYVDIEAGADVQKVFNYYAEKMDYLKRKYPKATFIHVTVPLTTVETGPKAMIKRLIGRSPDRYSDDIKRNEYNELLRDRYSGKEPVFDLAKAESISADGRSATFTQGGKAFGYLPQEFTSDGGHLNERGRKIVAEQLLAVLAGLQQ